MASTELDVSFMLLNQTFALADFLSLNVFVGIELPSNQRCWSTNGRKFQFDFMGNELIFRDSDLWLKPGRLAGEEVIAKDTLFDLMTDGITSVRSYSPIVSLKEEELEDRRIVESSTTEEKEDLESSTDPPEISDEGIEAASSSDEIRRAEPSLAGVGKLSSEREADGDGGDGPQRRASNSEPPSPVFPLDDDDDQLEIACVPPALDQSPATSAPLTSTDPKEELETQEPEVENREKDLSGSASVARGRVRTRRSKKDDAVDDSGGKKGTQPPKRSTVHEPPPSSASASQGGSQIKCRISIDGGRCGLSFSTGDEYEEHYKRVHCVCPHCQRPFSKNNTLRKHIRTVHEKKKPHECLVCGKTFAQGYELKLHHRSAHDEKEKERKQRAKRKKFVPSEPRPEFDALYKSLTKCKPTNECSSIFLRCLKCKAKFGSREERLVHYKEAHATCGICQREFKDASTLKKHTLAVHQKLKPFECSECDKKFAFKASLDSHAFTHTGVKNRVCSHCGKTFARASELNNHTRIVHLGQKDHACPRCSYKFYTLSRLRLHIKSVHEGIKDIQCSQCDKMFATTTTMRQHLLLVHRDLRPFACLTCGKSFKVGHHLRRHMLTHGCGDVRVDVSDVKASL